MAADELKRRADELADEIVATRRDLHRHPELGFEERRTSALVARRLRELDLEVRTEIAVTGVAGLLRAKNPEGPAVLLRADMDALPIREVAGREYGSEVEGKMHACGHDGHTAMLLGAARLLGEMRDRLARDVVFCFQPAEEGMGGGERMVQEGVLDWVETGEAYALHLWSLFEAGTVHVRPGPIMAAQDEFEVRIVGSGGHGAQPHLTRDPIVAAAHVVTALQTVVARAVDPLEAAVVTVGALHAGTAPNIIPDDAVLLGTMRCFADDVREILRRRVHEACEAAATAAGCRAEFELKPGFPATVNHEAAVEHVRRAGAAVFGAEGVREPAPLAAAEDFAYYLNERPGAFILVGAGNAARGITAPHHSPQFDIDESVLPRGTELLARLALG